MHYKSEIDGLRGISIVSVVIFHAKLNFLKGGFLGVDIFFVISGFLITALILEKIKLKEFYLINFWEQRARRILPGLIIINIFCIVLSIVLMLPDDLLELSQSSISSIFFYSNYFFWQKIGYFNNLSEFKPLLHTWSLSIEEQFYVALPILIISILKFLKKNFLLIFFTLFFFSSIVFATYASKYHPSFNFYMIFSRAWELLLGSILSLFYKKNKYKFNYINDFCLIVLFLFLFNSKYDHPSIYTLFFLIPVCILIINEDRKSILDKLILKSKVLIFLGLISYSLYLWHVPIFSFYRYFKLFNISELEKVFLLILCVLFASLSYKFIENPIRKKKILISQKIFCRFCLLFLCLITLSSFYIIYKKGFLNSKYNKSDRFLTIKNDHINNPDYTKCLANQNTKISQIKKNCFDESSEIIIWGDSTAASLGYGLKKKLKNKVSILASSSCPPLININFRHRPLCQKNNYEILEYIKKSNAKYLILQSAWLIHSEYLNLNDYKIKLLETISLIKNNNKNIKILVIGDTPSYKIDLPKILLLKNLNKKPNQYVFYENYNKSKMIDLMFEKISNKNSNFIFLSLIEYLCNNEKKCLATIFNEKNEIIPLLHDNVHLTESASIMIFENFLKDYLK